MKRKNILYLGLDPSRYPHEGELFHLPLIRTVPRPFDQEIQNAFENLRLYTHILFTSRTAIPIYKEYALKARYSERMLNEKMYLCVGKATALRLRDEGFIPNSIAEEETAEGVVSLLMQSSLEKGHLFFPRSAQGRDLIPCYLKERKILFTALDLYDTLLNPVTLPHLEDFDEIVFTSPSTVHAFFALNQTLPPIEKCVSIGPITKKTLKDVFS